MVLLLAIVVMVCFARLAYEYWQRLFAPESTLGTHPFSRWLWSGLIVPIALWMILNCGLISAWPPLIPEIAWAKSAGSPWIPLVFQLTVPGLLTIASFWAAVTFIHLTMVIGLHAESRQEFGIVVAVLGLLTSPLVWLFGIRGGLPWAGMGLLFWLVPVAHCTTALASKRKAPPLYARAMARMKLGKYREAESEVIQQLESSEEDFEGWMLLAELYATKFGDLAEADRTVRAVCNQPNVTSLQISLGLHRLADWHLKLGNDPVGARRALMEVSGRLPGTHFARMAQLRAQQLPSSRQEWLDQQKPRTIALPSLGGELDEPIQPNSPQLSRKDAADLANDCVERLEADPNNVSAREKLATICVEQLGKIDLGIEQIQLLLDMPEQPEKKRAEWLSRLAAWHFRYRHDAGGAKRVLQQLIQEHPQSAQGFAAQRWLNLLAMEQRHDASRGAADGAPKTDSGSGTPEIR